MNKSRRIDFKSLSKLEQNIIYEYNSKVYCEGFENANKFLSIQKEYQDIIVNRYVRKLTDKSIEKINIYIQNHRKFNH